MRGFQRSTCALAVLLASTALAEPAWAQVASPSFRQLDDNGVDLVQGDLVASFTEGSIGSGEGAMGLIRSLGMSGVSASQASQWDRIRLNYIPGNGTYVDFGTRSDKFPGAEVRGSTLSGGGGSYQYTTPDGTVIAFTNNEPENDGTISNLCRSNSANSCILVPTSITSPDGKIVTLAYEFWSLCIAQTPQGQLPSPDDPIDCTFTPRLKKVSNSYGYSIAFSYASGAGGFHNNPPATFYQRTGAQFFNDNVSTITPQATVSYAYPLAGVTDITDMGGRVWRMTGNTSTVAIRRPGAAADTTTYNLSSGKVTSVIKEGVTTSYARSVVGSTITMTVTNALNQSTVVTADATIGRATSVKDPLNRTTAFQYDWGGRLTRTTLPEGNYVQLTYDARGNVTETRAVSKTPGTPADIVSIASYPSTCANMKTCNKPDWTRDARGNQTDYTYDVTHGGVLTVTAPSPTGGPVRPQTRYSYSLLNGEYRVTSVSACQTLSSCAGTADEVRTNSTYDPANGNLTSTSTGAGNGTLTATSSMTYDAMGNLLTVDGPLAGNADTIRYRYNSARELIGTVSPDPDGAGALKLRAVRNSYNASGQLWLEEIGTVTDQSDPAWAAFATAYRRENQIDTNGRTFRRNVWSNNVYYGVVDYVYDGLGRLSCSVTKMDPNNWASQATSCQPLQTNGPYGADRVAKTVYNNAGEVIEQRVSVGIAGQETATTFTYSNNGKLKTLKDAENNLTTYIYDGFDRLSQTQFPNTPKGSGTSNAGDFEQLTYDANSNVTSRQLRGTQVTSIAFTYDNLNRPTLKNLPGSEPDATYGYDLLGRLTSASQTGQSLTFTYDALGRLRSETGPIGTVAQDFDPAGRRTALTTSSGHCLQYQHLVTGEMSALLDCNPIALATFTYDDLGRRTGVSRYRGTSSSWGYDPVSRLTSLSHDFAGSANDVSWTFAYNPAGQIVSTTRSNDAFAFQGLYAVNRTYTSNGLNQYSAAGPASFSYDGRGNLTSDGTSTFGYSSENQLTSTTGGVTLSYDPLGRLYQSSDGVTVRRYQYAIGESGAYEAIGEYDGSNIAKHYHAFGPGVDEPMFWWDMAAGGAFRPLHADERGSIIAASDWDANAIAINRYDEYGIPQSGNAGRFQYTGQMWLPELGMYHYKARIYSPTLGRFLQTDPAGGSNLYAYVGNDPIGNTDPSGMIPRSNLADDDMSRFIDFTPQGTGWGTHSYDGMGNIATYVSGRIDELVTLPNFLATASLDQLAYVTVAGGVSRCVQYCNAGGVAEVNGEIVVPASPVYSNVGSPPNRIQFAQLTPFPPGLLPPANDNETRAEICEMGARVCSARARMIPDPVISRDYMGACAAALNSCLDRAFDDSIRTDLRITFPDGTTIVFGPGGRVFFVPNRRR
jgi:RHS repeat-associated protein